MRLFFAVPTTGALFSIIDIFGVKRAVNSLDVIVTLAANSDEAAEKIMKVSSGKGLIEIDVYSTPPTVLARSNQTVVI